MFRVEFWSGFGNARRAAAPVTAALVLALAGAPAVAQVATGGSGSRGGGNGGAAGTSGGGAGGGTAGTLGSPNGGPASALSSGGGGGFSFTFSGSVGTSSTGGSGGQGAIGPVAGGKGGGGGGGGGDGAQISASSAVTVSATVSGGIGGGGGIATNGPNGGGGGGGGAGVVMETGNGLTVNAAVSGGAGGAGGGTDTGGGGGGAGVILEQGGSLTINANVSGGASGGGAGSGGGSVDSGNGGSGVLAGGSAAAISIASGVTVAGGGAAAGRGSGGAGLTLSAGGTVINAGSISGGSGGGICGGGVLVAAGGNGSGGALGGLATGQSGCGEGGAGIVGSGLSITNSGSIAGGSGQSGVADAIQFTGGSNSLTLAPGYSFVGNVVGTGADTFQLGGSGNATFNLGLIGAGQQFQGFSTFNVVGADWTVTGTYGQTNPWTVEGGTLNVTGDLSNAMNLTVTGGTLMGTGTVGNTQINSGGTFAPGSGTPGSAMMVSGNLTFASSAQYLVFLNPATSSFANVSGTAALNGTVAAVFAPASYVTKQYTILESTGLNGTMFAGLTNTDLPNGFTDSLSYSSNDDDVFLNLTAALGAGTPLTGNQQAVANTINNFFNAGGALPPGFVNVFNLTGGNLANALTQLDGENATGAEKGAFQLMNEFLDLMLDPFVYGRGGGLTSGGPLGFAPDQPDSLPPDIALAYDAVLKAPPKQTFAQRWTAWGSGFGGSATTNGDSVMGSNNVATNTYGYAAGMDYHYSPDTVVGFSLAGGGTGWNLAQGLGTGHSNAVLAGLYGVTHEGPVYLAGALAFANNWFTTNRIALGDQLTANFQGQSYAARLEGGYRFAVPLDRGLAGVTPYAAVQVQDFHTPAYSETDLTAGGFGLSYAAMNGTDTRSELGARFDDPTLVGNMPLILRARVAWAHDWVSNPALNAAFESLPGTGFTVNGAPIPQNSALTSAGAQLFFTPNWSFLAKFDGEFASGSQTYAGSGTLRYTW